MSRRPGRRNRISSITPFPKISSFYGAGGIKLHHDANLGVTLVSGRVSQWNDQTGNGNNVTQGTAGQRPLFIAADTPGGTPAIHFDDTARNLNKTSGSTTQANAACTIFAVLKIASNGTRIWSHDNAAGSGGVRIDSTAGNRVTFFWGTSGVTDGAFDSSNYEVWCWRLAAAGGYGTAITTKDLYVNGVLQSAPSGTPNMTQGTVEYSFGVNGTCPNVKFAEFAEAPDSLIAATDCIALSRGLMAKHGIA